MRVKNLLTYLALSLSLVTYVEAQGEKTGQLLPYQDSTLSDDERATDLMKRMTLEEKVDFVTGNESRETGIIGTLGITRLGMPDLRLEHGPYGFRGYFAQSNSPKGTFFPVSVVQAATWDRELVERVNRAMGAEFKAAKSTMNAAPSMNIVRDPRCGRNFEYFTEDPYLNGVIATAHVKGIQSQKVIATVKHYACNNQEFDRNWIDVIVDERTLREIYLPGYKAAIQDGGAWSVMGAYNKVNGVHSCENKFLLNDILRDEWGFKGFVGSDWSGTHNLELCINAGLDLELPRPRRYGAHLLKAMKEGKFEESQLNTMVENILRTMFWAEIFDKEPVMDESQLSLPETLAIAREVAAEGTVLLKNEDSTLPLDPSKGLKIALIGPSGDYGMHSRRGYAHSYLFQGGGSASMSKSRSSMVTIYDGLKAASEAAGANFSVKYAPGCYAETGCEEIPSKYLTAANGEEGLDIKIYDNTEFEGEPNVERVDTRYDYKWGSMMPIPDIAVDGNKRMFSARISGTLTAPATREYTFEVLNVGSAKLYINDELVASNQMGNTTDRGDSGKISLKEGERYELRVDYVKNSNVASLRIDWDYENDAMMAEALALAKESDVVVMAVGLSGNMGETENGDRTTIDLSEAQEALIKAITEVNKNVIVTVIAGSAVGMQEWVDLPQSIVMSWYGGEQMGNAFADVLFGSVNPSGKLPVTFPISEDQYPEDFHSRTKRVEYKEGIFVGYRYFDEYDLPVLFPFGHGLSYTTFDYSGIKCKRVGENRVRVSAKITNSGACDGAEVVQLYVYDKECSVPRPKKELKGFEKIELKSGESRVVEFELDSEAFSFWSPESREWTVEPGEFEIMLGSSSSDIRLSKVVKL